MINIKIENSKDNTFPGTFVFCSKCFKKTLFYSISPKKCIYCNNIFPDIKALKYNNDYRINWYKDSKNA